MTKLLTTSLGGDPAIRRGSAVFLDRDGVVIRTHVVDGKPYAIRSIDEYEVLPGVQNAIEQLKEAGFIVVLVTNQPDIDNGLVTQDIVGTIHNKLLDELSIDAIYMCPHNRERGCECRKPAPGMLFQAKNELGLDLHSSWMVGDRASDIGAGIEAGCRCVFIDCNYKETIPTQQKATVQNLPEAIDFIITCEGS